MDVQTKDGILLRGIPEGTPDEAIKARIAKIRSERAAPQDEEPAPVSQEPSEADLLAGSPAARFAMGSASPFLGAGQLIANVAGFGKPVNEHLRELEEMKKRGMTPAANLARLRDSRQILAKLPGYEAQIASIDKQIVEIEQSGASADPAEAGIDVAGVAGSVVSPAFLAAAKAIPGGLTYIQKILAGMGMGAAAGAAAPVTSEGDFTTQKAGQIGTGAAVGGAVPALLTPALAVGRGGYRGLVEPWLNPTAIKGRALLEAAGDKTDDIVALLRQNKQIVPGSTPSAGQAAAPAGSAEFSAFQKSAERAAPSVYDASYRGQDAARLAAVRAVGKDSAALEAAEAARKAAADPLYAAAREGKGLVYSTPIVKKIDLILSKNPGNRELVSELANIKAGLEKAGSDPQKVASVLDGMKAAMKDEKNSFIRGVLTTIKNDLATAIPGYAKAQAVFAAKSAPINQMQIGQHLEQKLTSPLDETARQRAASYAGALREAPATIKRATGAARFENLNQVLTPKQLEVVNSVRDDLARGVRFEELAKRGHGTASAMDVATQSMERAFGGKVPGMLERGVLIANSIIGRLEGRINQKLAAEIAAEMLNPTGVAKSLEEAVKVNTRSLVLARSIENSGKLWATAAAHQAAK